MAIKNLSLSLLSLQAQQIRLPFGKKKKRESWTLSSGCQILLSNQKLCIQSEQSAGLALVQDFRPLIMTLASQPKHASRFSAALEAGNPQEVWWSRCQTAGTTY